MTMPTHLTTDPNQRNRTPKRFAFAAGLIFAMAAFAGCSPEYPTCSTDKDCAEQSEVCVNGQCQECREDQECTVKYVDEGRLCNYGRCEVPPECMADADCSEQGEGWICRDGTCRAECELATDCASGQRCLNARCVAECSEDADCGSKGASCSSEGRCTTDTRKLNASCFDGNNMLRLQSVRFGFNVHTLSQEAQDALRQNLDCLLNSDVRVVIEGHCDMRGTQEYNLALGEKRANAVRNYLRTLGVPGNQMRTRSKGENQPICRQSSEDCWQRNRRVSFIQETAGR